MRKLGMSGVFALLITSLFAVAAVSGQAADQFGGPKMMGGGGMMQGHGPNGFEWKQGTSVNAEYKKATGQVVLNETFLPLFKSEGVSYVLMLPKRAEFLLTGVKSGDTVTFEGIAVTLKKADTATQYIFHPFEALVNGKTIKLFDQDARHHWGDHRGMMGPNGPEADRR